MQPVGPGANSQDYRTEPGNGTQDRGLVLPRFLRKPVRHGLRLLNGGFRISRRGLAGWATAFAFTAGLAGFAGSGDVQRVHAGVASGLGIAIDSYEISGNSEVSDIDIVSLLAPEHGTSILGYDVAAARDALKQNPWIADAQVSKVYPDKLAIRIDERSPFALWQNEHGLFLIDREGNILSEFDGRSGELPLVVGKGAEKEAANMLSALQRLPQLAVQSRALIRVGERRWDIETDDGVTIMLPESGEAAVLARFAEYEAGNELLSRDIERVDLRLRDRLVVRMSEEAGKLVRTGREEQIRLLDQSRKERNT